MEVLLYILIGIVVLLIILIILLLFTVNKKDDGELKLYLKDENNRLKMELVNYVNNVNNESYKNVNFINKQIDEKFKEINEQLHKNIKENNEKTSKTFMNVTERLVKLDEQNKSVKNLSVEVLTLNNLLSDKKTRGVFGEVQLTQILESTFASNKMIYEEQYKLSNGRIVDAIIHTPKPLGSIGIDSKFPLETFNKISKTDKKEELKILRKQFDNDLKKHISDIKDRYIVKDETANQAIMFIPAEGVYNEIIKNHIEVVNYANNNRVWITSPTSLLSTLTVIQVILNNLEKEEKTNEILMELKSLSVEFERYIGRWNSVYNSTSRLVEDLRQVNITSNKISNKFEDINKLNI